MTSVTPKITYEKQDVPLVDSESIDRLRCIPTCGIIRPVGVGTRAPLPTTMVLAGQYKIRILFEESRPQVTRFFPGGSEHPLRERIICMSRRLQHFGKEPALSPLVTFFGDISCSLFCVFCQGHVCRRQ